MGPVRRHHHVPRYCRQDAEGDHRPRPQHHEDQDHRSSREEVLRLDRWLHPGFSLHLRVHVDFQGGVRRVRCLHRPQEVLLESYLLLPSARLLGKNQFSMTKRIQLFKINTSHAKKKKKKPPLQKKNPPQKKKKKKKKKKK